MPNTEVLAFRQDLPAVDDDRGAGYIGCIIRSQEQNRIGHVARRSEPPERYRLLHSAQEFRAPVLGDALGQNIAWLHAIDRDSIGGKLDGRCLDEAVDSSLGGRIMTMAWRCDARTGDGGCEDHSPAAL